MALPFFVWREGKLSDGSLPSANICFGKVLIIDGKGLPKEFRGHHPKFSTIVVEIW